MAKNQQKKQNRGRRIFGDMRRAICDARIATIYQGRRVVMQYYSGQPLVGRLPERADGMF